MKNKIFIVVYFTILCLPVFQKIIPLLPETKLSGIEWEELRDPLVYQNIISGSFQESFTKWFNQRIGFRSIFIKSYNQFHYSFFNTSPNTKVVIGKEGQLYLSGYINNYYSKNFDANIIRLTENIKKFKKAQNLFNERGVNLILLISPSKASIYSEDIPEEFKKPGIDPDKDHETFLTLLDKYNVNYIDSKKIFMNYKIKSKYALFPKLGIHWNLLGTSLVLNELFDKVEFLSKRQLPKFHFDHINLDNEPEGAENDLALLLNLWENPVYGTFPHPSFEKQAYKNIFRPNTLIVGSSFTIQIAELLDNYNMTTNLSRFDYYRSRDTYSHPIGKLDWNEDVFTRELIILENNEEVIPGRYGFIDDAITMMTLNDLNNVTFPYKNEKYVTSLLMNGRIKYQFKKEVSSPTIYLKSNKIKFNKKYITVSFFAKDFAKIQCHVNPGKLISSQSINTSAVYKKYTYVFETTGSGEQDYELLFFADDTYDAGDRDTYIKDVKMYATKH